MELKSAIHSLLRYRRENGLLLLTLHVAEGVRSRAVGRILGRRLGNPVRIGPRARLSGLSHIKVGRRFRAGRDLWLEAFTYCAETGTAFQPQIVIKDNVGMSDFVHIAAINYVEIGHGVLIGSKVLITDHNHGSYSGGGQSGPDLRPAKRPLVSNARTIIGDNVWLGDNVVVLPGTSIAHGSIIGANSVVAGAIPPNSLAAGVPAQVIKEYCPKRNCWVRVGDGVDA